MNRETASNSLPTQIIEDLVVAVLSVNSYPMEKSSALLPSMRNLGLTDAQRVVEMSMEDLTVRLNNSGYDRGMLVGRMAERLYDLMKAIHSGQLRDLCSAIESKDVGQISNILMDVKGIGKKVIQNACLLFFS